MKPKPLSSRNFTTTPLDLIFSSAIDPEPQNKREKKIALDVGGEIYRYIEIGFRLREEDGFIVVVGENEEGTLISYWALLSCLSKRKIQTSSEWARFVRAVLLTINSLVLGK